jgi:hypothetical protein
MLGRNHPRGGLYHSCAVVGSSGLLLKYQLGDEIDSHAAVFRLNDAPTAGYASLLTVPQLDT